MATRLLIIEDEKNIGQLLKDYFIEAGYDVALGEDGSVGLELFNKFRPHIIILDRMLPGISGDQVCEEIRKLSTLPILMLTAKSDEDSRIEGFELGVDDYVTKPFSAREVIFRVRALVSRSYPEGINQAFNDGYLSIDQDRRVIHVQGEEAHMTANEYDLIEALYKASPRPLSRGQLVENVFGYAYEAYDRNIDTYIKNIRHKIEENPKEPVYIRTKYGVGYYFGKKD